MRESELFELLEQTADAAFTVADSGEICSWNSAAEQLFGYTARDVLGRNFNEILDVPDIVGRQALDSGNDAAPPRSGGPGEGIPAFDLEVRNSSGKRIWVNVSPIIFEHHQTRPATVCAAWRPIIEP